MRLIDADALNLDHEVEMADDWKTAHEIANCVKYAPTVAAVPLEPLAKFIVDNLDPRVDCLTCSKIDGYEKRWCANCPEMNKEQVMSALKKWMEETNAPTINAMPVVHGKWIDKPNPRWPAYDIRYCSECGWNIPKSKLRNVDENWLYCPQCGAQNG